MPHLATPIADHSSPPAQSLADIQSREAFLALMWALSYPGARFALPNTLKHNPTSFASVTESLLLIGIALLDLEATYFASDEGLAHAMKRTGAVAKPPNIADYLFYTSLHESDLPTLEQIKIGNDSYPDQSATLILGCALDPIDSATTTISLRGPGIAELRSVHLAGVPIGFWEMRQRLNRYPLGIDVVLVSDGWVLGLPRTTQVSVCM